DDTRHTRAIVEPEYELTTAILRRRLTLDLGQPRDDAARERRPKLLRQVGHRLEIHDALAIDPGRELTSAIARRAELDRKVFHLGRQHSDEVLRGHRTKNNTAIALQNRRPVARAIANERLCCRAVSAL